MRVATASLSSTGTMADGASKYAETEEVLQDIVALFSAKDDMHAVKESGKAIAELQAAGEARHREMLDSVKGAQRARRPPRPPRARRRSAPAPATAPGPRRTPHRVAHPAQAAAAPIDVRHPAGAGGGTGGAAAHRARRR